jgi:hypothetical protein
LGQKEKAIVADAVAITNQIAQIQSILAVSREDRRDRIKAIGNARLLAKFKGQLCHASHFFDDRQKVDFGSLEINYATVFTAIYERFGDCGATIISAHSSADGLKAPVSIALKEVCGWRDCPMVILEKGCGLYYEAEDPARI